MEFWCYTGLGRDGDKRNGQPDGAVREADGMDWAGRGLGS